MWHGTHGPLWSLLCVLWVYVLRYGCDNVHCHLCSSALSQSVSYARRPLTGSGHRVARGRASPVLRVSGTEHPTTGINSTQGIQLLDYTYNPRNSSALIADSELLFPSRETQKELLHTPVGIQYNHGPIEPSSYPLRTLRQYKVQRWRIITFPK